MRKKYSRSDSFRHAEKRGLSISGLLLRRPKEFVGSLLIATAALAVVLNALFLQAGPHPAPIMARKNVGVAEVTTGSAATPAAVPRPPAAMRAEPAAVPKATPVQTAKAPAASATSGRADLIGDLLEPSNRVMAIQRTLSEYGYGQIKATGTVNADTKAAIEKFEREHKLPVTGQVSDRLARELTALKGGPL